LSVLFNSRSHLKSIFSLFIALLRHWGPHATSINNKIFRHLINKTVASLHHNYRYPISPTHFAVGAFKFNIGWHSISKPNLYFEDSIAEGLICSF
jgi:hypothetical protein